MDNDYVASELEAFRQYLLERDKSPDTTVKTYVYCVKRYLTEFHENIGELKTHLRKRSDSTGNMFKSAIKSYFKFRKIDYDPELLKAIRPRDQKRNLIDRKKIPEMVAKHRPHHRRIKRIRKNILIWRNYCIIGLIAYTGIRPTECASIKYKDVDIKAENIWIKGIKREEPRNVFPPVKIFLAIEKYTELAGISGSDSLFGISPLRINSVVKEATGYPPKDFRTTFGTEIAIQTKDPYMVMKLMGHRDISSAMPYLDLGKNYAKNIKEVMLYE